MWYLTADTITRSMFPVYASLAAALVSGIFNLSVGIHMKRHPKLRPYRAAPAARFFVAAFSLFYVVAFGWLATGVDQGEWSRALIWVAPMTFVSVWSLDAAAYVPYVLGRRKAHDNDQRDFPRPGSGIDAV